MGSPWSLAHQGHAVVVAAGNSGPKEDTVLSPGAARDVITVAATDKDGRITEYSSRGPHDGYALGPLDQARYSKPDLVAPGGGVKETAWEKLRRMINPLQSAGQGKGFSAGELTLNPVAEGAPSSRTGEPSGPVPGSGGKGNSPALNPFVQRGLFQGLAKREL